jgi:D-sedoheptulose 7-phosphate isomerase
MANGYKTTMTDDFIRRHLAASEATMRRVADVCAPDIARAASLLVTTFRAGGKLLLCGNGGSAADCQHLAAEFMNTLTRPVVRPPLPAIALTTDTSLLTAVANDHGFEGVFARQVLAVGRAGDVLMAISTSGDSPNILRALEAARAAGLQTILLSGETGGKARPLAHATVLVPSTDTQRIQEAHITVGHMLCHLVERALFPDAGTTG